MEYLKHIKFSFLADTQKTSTFTEHVMQLTQSNMVCLMDQNMMD